MASGNPIAKDLKRQSKISFVLLTTTVFLSAFLLFQVQPIIGKYILPWFGAAPGVWATALLFFQLMLLGGYAYAHFIVRHLSWNRQAILHTILLGLALISLPITPTDALKPTNAETPSLHILLILMTTIGGPYLLLSATAPLVQRWHAQLHPKRSAYRLYALSNLGSLLALLSYPILVEPYILLQSQTLSWSWGYLGFALLCAGCALTLYHSSRELDTQDIGQASVHTGSAPTKHDQPTWETALLWLLLSGCGSGLLLATTNQMSMDIAVVPFLWILPLSIYLLTFILAFDNERWYVRPLFVALLPLALINALRLLYGGIDLGIVDQVLGYSLTLFICCMCCHGELSRARPTAHHLTFFFLVVSIGGALGGLFVAILSPALFSSFYEYHLLLVACYVLVGFVIARFLITQDAFSVGGQLTRSFVGLCWAIGLMSIIAGTIVLLRPETWLEGASPNAGVTFARWQIQMRLGATVMGVLVLSALELWRRSRGVAFRIWWVSGKGFVRTSMISVAAAGLISLAGGLVWLVSNDERRTIEQDRNFFGTLAIKEFDIGSVTHRLSLTHGRIRHGSQLQFYQTWPTTYYGPQTGVGLGIEHHPLRSDATRQFRVGVVGLGVGTIAAYANAQVDPKRDEESYVTVREVSEPDYMRFYELNPLVSRWAKTRFTFLEDAAARGADVDIFEGDARIVLERQLAQGEDQRFDVLAIDAFSSDAIPIHLLTLESIHTYLAHLNVDGILALHITNRFIDLLPIVQRLAEATNLNAIYIENSPSASRSVSLSAWVLLTRNQAFLDLEIVGKEEREMPGAGPLWTDDYSSLFGIVEINPARRPLG